MKIFTALGLVLALTSCGSQPAPQVTVTKTVTQDSFSYGNNLDMVGMIRSQDSWFNNMEDETIIGVSNSICDGLRNGLSVYDVASVVNEFMDREHVASIMAGAIMYICPDQEYKLS